MYLGSFNIDELCTFTVNTFDAGAEADADSAPTYRVYENETGTPILTGTMAKLDDANTLGFYSEQITVSAANGFEQGKSYNIRIAATVDGVPGATVRSLQVAAAVNVVKVNGEDATPAGTVDANVVKWAGYDAVIDAFNLPVIGTVNNDVGGDVRGKIIGTGGTDILAPGVWALGDGGEAIAIPGDEMTLTTATLTQLFTDTDTTALVNAIIARVESDLDGSDLSVAAIATAVRNAILDRVLAGNHDVSGTPGKLLQRLPASGTVAVPGDAMILTSAYDSAKTAATQTSVNAIQTDTTDLLARLGAFSKTGVNTVLGFFKAIFSAAATTPSDMGGTGTAANNSLQAIRTRGDAAWTTGAGGGGGGGEINNGDTLVDHNTGGTDNLRVTTGGVGVDNATVRWYLRSEWDTDRLNATLRGKWYTKPDGRAAEPAFVNKGFEYAVVAEKPEVLAVKTQYVTVPA